MATIGDRIKRARLARGWTGEQLAEMVGYKNQSAISNLENRGGGTGGKKLPEIARVLRVPLGWLVEGPDDADVPFSEPVAVGSFPAAATLVTDVTRPAYDEDESIREVMYLFKKLRTEERLRVIRFMRELLENRASDSHQNAAREGDPIPGAKAA